jgi:hypothetical protein
MNTSDAFKLIATRVNDPHLQREALKSLRATGRNVQMRLQWLLPDALASGDFTDLERADMIALLEPDEGQETERRDAQIVVRVTPSRRDELEQRAGAAGMSLSDYIRSRLFSGESEGDER